MTTFLADVTQGLRMTPKKLSSKYFYDKKGDALFQRIMELDEYYLPECEMDIIANKSEELASYLTENGKSIEIIELGAGDGIKTKHLLKAFVQKTSDLKYIPLDISGNILKENERNILEFVKDIEVEALQGNYFKTYPNIKKTRQRRLVLFLGGNIGNYLLPEALEFMNTLKIGLEAEDHILIAFDLVKQPRKIINAYDDSEGVTKAFNLNLLQRINRELGGNFNISKFDHFPYYNPVNGITYSHLISLESQNIKLGNGETFHFDAYEPIHTEVSKKYFKREIAYLAEKSGMPLVKWMFDSKEHYTFVLFKKV